MKHKRANSLIVAVVAALFVAPLALPFAAFADAGPEGWTESGGDAYTQELLDKVSQLTQRVEELEGKITAQAPAAGSDRLQLLEDRLAAQESITAGGFESGGLSLDSLPVGGLLQGVEVTGFIDTSYTFNFNQPESLTNGGLHAFDTGSNDFALNMVEIALEKSPDPVGWRIDLNFGDDAEILSGTEDELDIQQAYISYTLPMDKVAAILPWFDGITGEVIAGKFVTMAGAELIESKDNWNFSRSLLFFNAIPFQHTGVRSNWNIDGWLDAVVGVNNGWDIHDDSNQAKTVEAAIGFSPLEFISTNLAYYYGSEQADVEHAHRNLLDLIVTVTNPWKEIEVLNPLTVMFNMDYGREQDAERFDNGGVSQGNDTVTWQGYAAYAQYKINDWISWNNRWEIFRDLDGFRSGIEQDIWELTSTAQFDLTDNLITRIEFRHDNADLDSTFGDGEDTSDTQNILYLEAIVSF